VSPARSYLRPPVLLAFDQLTWLTLRLQHAATALGLSWLVALG